MKNFHLLLTLLVINCLLVTCSKEQGVQIRGGVPIFLHPDEPSSVHKAVLDLQRDLEAVLGKPSEIVDQLPESGAVIVIATGDRCTGSHPAPTGWEAHQLYTDGNQAYRMLHLNRMLSSLTRTYRETAGTPQRKEYLQQSIREMELLKEQLS